MSLVGRLEGFIAGRPMQVEGRDQTVTFQFDDFRTAWMFWRRVVKRLPRTPKFLLRGCTLFVHIRPFPPVPVSRRLFT